MVTQSDDGGGKQKEARLYSVIFILHTGQERGHRQPGCVQSPAAVDGGDAEGVTLWGWRQAADVIC